MPVFTLQLKLNTTSRDEQILDKRFFYASKVKNVLVTHCKKCLNRLSGDPAYHALRQQYHDLKVAGKKAEAKVVSSQLNALITAVGLTKNDLEKYAKVQQHKYAKHLDANTVQAIAGDVFTGVEKVLYGNGRELHFQKALDCDTIRGKTNKQGIRFRRNRLLWNGLDIGVQLRKGDTYAREALKNPVKLCRIKRIILGSRWHYYIQLVLEGTPPEKHRPGKGDVGIDNGTSVFAVVSEDAVSIEPLGADVSDLEEKIVKVQQAIDRSMRATNPQNYAKDGTIKKGRKRWDYSRRCRVLRRRLRGLYRRKAARIQQGSEQIANRILAQGNRFITEPVALKALQRRAKETSIDPKTGRPNKKKRFGKSIARHTPGAVLRALDRKLHYFGLQLEFVDLSSYRASQYDHTQDTYQKKSLSQRWVKINGRWVQRDLYSAFLLKYPAKGLKAPDRALCEAHFDKFLSLHDAYIAALQDPRCTIRLPSCCGIRHKQPA